MLLLALPLRLLQHLNVLVNFANLRLLKRDCGCTLLLDLLECLLIVLDQVDFEKVRLLEVE